jgi:hypothetical protein
MSNRSVQLNLPPTQLQSLSSADAAHETPRKSLKEWGDLPAEALRRAAVTQQAAAIDMLKSESWVSRALRGLEKLGWSDIGAIEDPRFWQELIELVAEFRGVSFGGNERDRLDAAIGRRVREVQELLR